MAPCVPTIGSTCAPRAGEETDGTFHYRTGAPSNFAPRWIAMVVTILICVSLILTGAILGKPAGWVVLALAVLALLLTVGGAHLHIG
jgi:hypothetical protein